MPSDERQLSGFNVGLVAGDDALRAALRFLLQVSCFLALKVNPNHCVIVDCSVRDMPGRRLCERILRSQTALPVVAVSAWPEDLRIPRTDDPFIRVIRKPFDSQMLIETVRKAIRAGGTRPATQGDLPEMLDSEVDPGVDAGVDAGH